MHFNRLPPITRLEHFWDNQGDFIDSLSTTNFEYFLYRDKCTDTIYELKSGVTVSAIDVREISAEEIEERYPPGHKTVEDKPWD
nr:hypothetical protein [Allomuricauda sp.]